MKLLTTNGYISYLNIVAKRIHESKDYLTGLDAAIGDGDHWVNMEKGFKLIVDESAKLRHLPLEKAFKEIAKLFMSGVGGSSGVLYGSSYLAAAKTVAGKDGLQIDDLLEALGAMLQAIMSRGQAQPGFKTMIDALAPAVDAFKECREEDLSDKETLEIVSEAATKGAEKTKDMKAVKGRACYQLNKGVGHIDPGAVTMAYQINSLCDYIIANNLE